MRVHDIMTPDPVTVGPDTSLKDAARLMADGGFSGLPVVDAEGRVVGVVTEADYLVVESDRAGQRSLIDLFLGASLAEAKTVDEIMTPFPAVIDPSASVVEAARQMSRRNINRLPVVDGDGNVVGVVARSDIVRAMADEVEPDPEV